MDSQINGQKVGPGGNLFAQSGLFMNTADIWTPFKMSFEGFAGAGKTFTMSLVALGLWEAEGKQGTVILQDTERSAKFIVPFFREKGLIEGKNFFVTPSRSLIDFLKIIELAEQHRAIVMVDTVTHLHEEMLRQFSIERKRPVVYPQDALILKPMWKEKFSTPFVEARCHILFSGRAAWEYTMERNEETGKKEFNATGVKMRGDNEVAFEPDVLILMEREQEVTTDGVKVYRLATVLKDRSRILDGKQFKNPSWEDFKPVYHFLASGSPDRTVPAETPMGPLFKPGNAETYWAQRRQVEILIEEIEGIYNQWMPGTGGLEKQLRSIIFNLEFQTRSKTALAELAPEALREGKEVVEHLAMFVAKHYDSIEKDYDNGNYEQINHYLAEEREKYLEQTKRYRAKEDDIPLFSSKVDNGDSGKSRETMIEEIIRGIEEVSSAQAAEELVSSHAGVIANLPAKDRKRIEGALSLRKRELGRAKRAEGSPSV